MIPRLTVSDKWQQTRRWILLSAAVAGIWELEGEPAGQLLRRRRGLRGDHCPWGWQVERRALQLQPALHLQERHRYCEAAGLNVWTKSANKLNTTCRSFLHWHIQVQYDLINSRGESLYTIWLPSWPPVSHQCSSCRKDFSLSVAGQNTVVCLASLTLFLH